MPDHDTTYSDCQACAHDGTMFELRDTCGDSRYTTLCERCYSECARCQRRFWRLEVDAFGNCPDCTCVCELCENQVAGPNDLDGGYCIDCSQPRCDSCGERYSPDELDADGYCDACRTPCCENCGDPSDYLDDEGYCGACRPARNIHEYSYHPRPIFVTRKGEKTNKDTVYLGVEVEMEGSDRDLDSDVGEVLTSPEWYAKQDGSLAHGVEIVSHPATYAWWSSDEATTAWMARFRSKGYLSYKTTTCGMHVHVSRTGLSKGALYRLLKFVAQNRDAILKLSRRKEENLNRWAAVDSDSVKELVRKAVGHDHPDRYSAVNTLPYKTVEFRFFRGTLDPVGFSRNLDLVWAICSFVKRSSNRGLGFEEFVKWLRSKASRSFLSQKAAQRLVAWFVDLYIATKETVVCV